MRNLPPSPPSDNSAHVDVDFDPRCPQAIRPAIAARRRHGRVAGPLQNRSDRRNGAGKSTLCRVLLEEEELDRGEVIRHPRLRLGYLGQHDPFQPGEKVLDFLKRDSEQPEWRCGEVAAEFELKGPQLTRPIAEFSGGWQTRVKLAGLLLHDPNLLVLDEPTNFLDLRTQLLLEQFLKSFRGGCLVVSHDRDFLRATCTHTLELAADA